MSSSILSDRNIGRVNLITPIILASVLGLAGVAQAQETKNEVESVVVTGKRVSEAAIAVGTDQATATVSRTVMEANGLGI